MGPIASVLTKSISEPMSLTEAMGGAVKRDSGFKQQHFVMLFLQIFHLSIQKTYLFPPTIYIKIFITLRHNSYYNLLRDSILTITQMQEFPCLSAWDPFQLHTNFDAKLGPFTRFSNKKSKHTFWQFLVVFMLFCISLWDNLINMAQVFPSEPWLPALSSTLPFAQSVFSPSEPTFFFSRLFIGGYLFSRKPGWL